MTTIDPENKPPLKIKSKRKRIAIYVLVILYITFLLHDPSSSFIKELGLLIFNSI